MKKGLEEKCAPQEREKEKGRKEKWKKERKRKTTIKEHTKSVFFIRFRAQGWAPGLFFALLLRATW